MAGMPPSNELRGTQVRVVAAGLEDRRSEFFAPRKEAVQGRFY